MEEMISIPKEELIDFLAAYMQLSALNRGGVDNWIYYGDNFSEEKANWFFEATGEKYIDEEEIQDMSFEDIAKIYIEKEYK